MPDFTPNAYMLEKHGDKGKEPWEIYAWCVRDAIAKQGNFKKLDEKLALNDKRAYTALMNGEADSAEINGQIFQYEGDEPVQDQPLISNRSLMRRKSTVTYRLNESENPIDSKPEKFLRADSYFGADLSGDDEDSSAIEM